MGEYAGYFEKSTENSQEATKKWEGNFKENKSNKSAKNQILQSKI